MHHHLTIVSAAVGVHTRLPAAAAAGCGVVAACLSQQLARYHHLGILRSAAVLL
jgi:hypothetical protein